MKSKFEDGQYLNIYHIKSATYINSFLFDGQTGLTTRQTEAISGTPSSILSLCLRLLKA